MEKVKTKELEIFHLSVCFARRATAAIMQRRHLLHPVIGELDSFEVN